MTMSKKNWLEWTVFAVGLLLLLATSGYLLFQAVSHGHQPAALSVTLGEPWTPAGVSPPHFIVPITVRNDGGQTAAEVDIAVELVEGGKPIERRELTFGFVPHLSSRSGALTFEHRPRPEQLSARVLGYLEP
jgi:uncharacterized protein (TIGR02588 family)